jgi:hypothetical protein
MNVSRIFPIVLLLLLILAGPVRAQDVSESFCGDLSQSDCQILRDSAAAMQALESTTFHLVADMSVTNVPNMPFDALTFRLTGDGSFAADVAQFQMPDLTSLEGMTFFQLQADLLRSVSADSTLTLELPANLTELLSTEELTIPDTISLDLRMVDGVAYLNLDEIAQLAPSVPQGWVGFDLAEFYDGVLPTMLEDASNASFDVVSLTLELMKPENMMRFVTIERLPDRVLVEQDMAVFQTSIDYAAMLDIPAFRDMLTGALGEADEVNVEESLAAIRAMYEGMTLVIVKCIGIEDKLVHSTEVQMAWDLAAFAETTGEEAAPQFAFNLLVAQEEFNTAAEVVAPEDATMLPLQGLFPASRPSE